ncbi:Uncharacterized protein Adt_24077 [Abeliophyllum distichum]|uniref:Uncharacterized protein n=1 Tax=Abeliophyllum distichum TaxID=126358 RepID=A0ABD1SCP6_9LAMI
MFPLNGATSAKEVNGVNKVTNRGTHPILATVPYYASPVWRRLKLIGPQAESYIAWKLGRGHIFFWHDCWMGDTTLADQFLQLPHSSIQVHDFFDDIGWNIDRLIQIVPLTMAEQIRSIPITPHVDDQIVWTDTSDGRFVTKSAWQLVRTGSNIQAVFRPRLPFSVGDCGRGLYQWMW